MRRAAKKDANHNDVCEALEKSGWRVRQTYQLGAGFPDAIAVKPGRVLFVEIKSDKKITHRRQGELTPAGESFARFLDHAYAPDWRPKLEYRIVLSVEDAVKL